MNHNITSDVTLDIIRQANSHGITFELDGERIKLSFAEDNDIDPALIDKIKVQKEHILSFLKTTRSQRRDMDVQDEMLSVSNGEYEYLPLSFSQERLWFIDKLQGSEHYHLPYILTLSGQLNTLALSDAIDAIVLRHEILRTVIRESDDIVFQQILPPPSDILHVIDNNTFSSIDERDAWIERFIERPFDLAADIMIRAVLIVVAPNEHLLAIVLHHIAFDGASTAIFATELSALYEMYTAGQTAALPALPAQYAHYAIWQRNNLSGPALATKIAYWKQKLDGLAPFELHTDFARPAIQSTKGRVVRKMLDKQLSIDLQRFSGKKEVTLFMTLLATFKVLLYRYCGQEDICIGTPIANRRFRSQEQMIGFFVNTLALRTILDGKASFDDLLNKVRATTLEAYQYQDTPFEKIVEAVVTDRDMSRSAIFQVMLTLHDVTSASELIMGDVQVFTAPYTQVTSQFDISLNISRIEDELEISFEYCADLFKENTILQMMEHFQHLLQDVVEHPEKKISELNMLSRQEVHHLLYELNQTAVPYAEGVTIIDLFEEQVNLRAEEVAVIANGQQISYNALNEWANKIAHFLVKQGVQPETTVAICLPRGIDMVAAILGVLKSGAAYVPIDHECPSGRMQHILSEARAAVLLADAGITAKLNEVTDTSLIEIGWLREQTQRTPVHNPSLPLNASSLAYILYTSGSTGRPKGVMIEQHNIYNITMTWRQHFHLSVPPPIFLSLASVAFDVFTGDLCRSLMNGGVLVLVPDDQRFEIAVLCDMIIRYGVTVMESTPGLIVNLVRYAEEKELRFPTLRLLIVGSDVFTKADYEYLAAWCGNNIRLMNGYGITEATVDSSYFEGPVAEYTMVPIGKPMDNMQFFVLDANQQLLPFGIPGELYVGGKGVGRGYIAQPELTKERFADNLLNGVVGRLYKTGDKVHWLPGGIMACHGRIDNQVKFRGYRIELEEIQNVLQQAPGVRQCIVILHKSTTGHGMLVAFVVPESGLELPAVITYMESQLPAYMLPVIQLIAELPLSVNGKVDRKQLPIPDVTVQTSVAYTAPRTSIEQALAAIWSELLGVEQPGIHDNFFALGGHSLLAMRVVAAIRKQLSLEISVKLLFDEPTIAGLSSALLYSSAPALPAIGHVEEGQLIPLSYSQERLWFLDRLQGSVNYHIPYVLRLRGALNETALEYSLENIVTRHQVLRTVIRENEGIGYQHVLPAEDWQLERYHATEQQLPSLLNEILHRPFDLSADMMLRAALITLSADEYVLVVVLHHIAADGWSIGTIAHELSLFYRGETLPIIPLQYGDYAYWQRRYVQGAYLESRLAYWKNELHDLSVLQLPTDYPRPAQRSSRGRTYELDIPVSVSGRLRSYSHSAGATLFMTMLTGLKILLHRYSGQEDICVGTPVAGRSHQELEHMVGFFVNTLALRSKVSGSDTFDELLSAVKQATLAAYEHQEAPFEKVVETVVTTRDLSRSALFDVMLVLQNTPSGDGLMFPCVDIKGENSGAGETKFDLTFNVEEDNALHVSILYNTDLFEESTISRMGAHYITLLDALVSSPGKPVRDVSMLSEVEEDLLSSFNHTSFVYPAATSITELFEAQVARTPNAPALSFAGETLSYAEMNHRVNQLAHYLREEQGCGVGHRVAIQLERSLEMVIAIYAVLKTGAAYVPVDPSYPLQRREYIMTDSEARYVLDAYPDVTGYSTDNPEQLHTADDAAYLIYTSGSTGTPKGVVILHHSLLNLTNWLSDLLYKEEGNNTLLTASINFDASVKQLFAPLISGQCLHIIEEVQRLDVAAYVDYLEHAAISVLDATPSYLQIVLHHIQSHKKTLPFLRSILAGGETLSGELYRLFREVLGPVPSLINVYGPTETCVDASWRIMDDTTPAGSIGRPLPNVFIYVLDEALYQTGIGIPGEICIGGVGLAAGYWRREALTAEKFIQHPEFGRLYRTGDQGRWTTTGELIYQGRLDDQVKLRGFRIELSEISNTLEQYPGVQQATVVLHTPAEGSAFLVGYYVAYNGVSRDEVTAYLQAALPEYMQPRLQELTEMPLTANGKVDRKQLPDPVVIVHTGDEYVAPRTATEQAIANIWSELLGVEKIGVYDNFFSLGGHSLLAMRVIAAIRKQLSLEISVKLLFDEPTIAGLSSALLYSSAPALPAIGPVEEGQLIPLSYSQERLWFLDRLQGSVNYHIPYVLRLRGALNETALEYSLKNIVTRHQVLRTVIRETEGTGYQQVLPAEDWQLERYHATEQQLPSLLDEILHSPFDLPADMMLRAALITLAADEHVLVVVLHHIAADGWSIGTIAHELSLLYRGETLPVISLQYGDYAYWQRRYVQGAYLESRLAYWKEQLYDLSVLQLPTDYPRPAQRSSRGRTYELDIPVSVSGRLRSYSHSAGATLFMTMLTGLKILLHRYSGQEDICVGTPVAGRSHQELEHMVGFFVNTLALRSKVSGSDTFDELLSAVKQGTLAAYEHQEAPFEKVVETVVTTRDLSRSALFDVMLVLKNTPDSNGLTFPGVDIEGEGNALDEAKFDLTFNIEEGDALHLSIQYSTDLFGESTISRMGAHYITLLDALVSSPGKPVRDVSMLSEVEEDLLSSFNHTSFVYPSATSITELFEAQVARTPNAPALSFAGETLSYAEMNHRVNQLAHYLREEQGCGVGDRVAIQLERSLEMVIAIYAVLKTGAAYVPVDPSYPLQRREYIMKDSEVRYVLDTYPDLAGYAIANPERRHTADDVAYLIYTSGSTGLPKGVVILHHSLLNLTQWLSDLLYKEEGNNTLLTASINFDASVKQLFAPLISGQCLHIIEEAQRLDVAAYVDYLEHAAISVLDATPSYLQIVLHHIQSHKKVLPFLRSILAGGEALSGELYRLFREVLGTVPELINVYGPTETCVDASWRIMDDTAPAGSIGRPLPNVSIYVLDEALHQTGIGIPGEICIGGVGLAAGYWRREALTAEKFIQHPEFGRLYRTGDQGRWTTTGELIYQGRLDDQVKLRGFRIELSEISNILEQYPGVQQATVVLHTPAEGTAFLVGYYVAHNGVSRDEITAYLQAALPEYMQPRLQELTEMPLTANGKVDRKQLPDPVVSLHTGDEYVAPRTATEQAIANIWSELLGVEQIGIHDNFFALGGHSLLAMRVVAAIRKQLFIDISIKKLFSHPTVAGLSAGQEDTSLNESTTIVKVTTGNRIPLSYAQQRLWFIDRLQGSTHYHMSYVLRLEGALNRDALQYAFTEIIRRHEILRTVIREDDTDSYQLVMPVVDCELTIYKPEYEAACQQVIQQITQQPFDLSADKMLRIALLELSASTHLLVVVLHHIASDGWSIPILAAELSELYTAYISGRVPDLPVLSLQYADYAVWQHTPEQVLLQERSLDYWKSQLEGIELLDLPTDRIRPSIQQTVGAVVQVELLPALSNALREMSRKQDVTLFTLLLTGLKVLLYRYSGQQDICIGTPVAGRHLQELEGLIGFFVNTLVLHTHIDGSRPFTALLSAVQHQLPDAFEHQDVPFEKVVDAVITDRDLSRNPLFQVAFMLEYSNDVPGFSLPDLTIQNEPFESTVAKFDLAFKLEEQGEALQLSLTYSTALFDHNRIVRMSEHYVQLLRSIVSSQSETVDHLQMISAAEAAQIAGFNLSNVNSYTTVPAVFALQVQQSAKALALIYEDQQLTYGTLDLESSRLANYLLELGVKKGNLVAVCALRGPDMLIAILAILKCGAGYVPIDMSYPSGRVSYMLNDSGACIVLVTGGVVTEQLSVSQDITWIMMDQADAWASYPAIAPDVAIDAEDIAYVMYTSGSTGQPKGVMITHGNIISLVKDVSYVSLGADDVLLSTGSPSFDAVTFEWWGMLLNGGRLILCSESSLLDIGALKQLIHLHNVNIMWFTSGWYNQLTDLDITVFRGLKTILVGGDRLSPAHISRVRDYYNDLRILNGYGPTENTTFSLIYEINEVKIDKDIPLGRPLEGRSAYILSSEGNAVGIGMRGEICLGGTGLGTGYWNQSELTAEKFIVHPKYGRLYRSGDIGCWTETGDILYLGRMDDQLKLRGYRIELGEIEGLISRIAGVKQCIVTVYGKGNSARLIGYIVPGDAYDREQATVFLSTHLPDYMRPFLYELSALPLTANGKVDRKQLPIPDIATHTAGEYISPRTATEQALANIWSELLGVEQIGVYDSFFSLGGHSLLAMRVVAAIRKQLSLEISVKLLFDEPTIAGLSSAMVYSSAPALPAIGHVEEGQLIPLSYSQERLWFLDRLQGSVNYHIPYVLRLRGALNETALEYSLENIVTRHQVLRTVIREAEGTGYQHVLPAEDWQLERYEATEQQLPSLLDEISHRPFDLSSDMMLRAALIILSADEHVLVVVLHHIAADGWSIGTIAHELSLLYRGETLPAMPLQYGDYAYWQRRYVQGAYLESRLAYWKEQLYDLSVLQLPTDYPRPAQRSSRGRTYELDIPVSLSGRLRSYSHSAGATLFMTMLTGLKILLHRYSGQEDICVGTPVAGRSHQELEHMVGFFVNTLALRSKVSGSDTFDELLSAVKQGTLAAYEHQEAPFEKVVETVVTTRDLSRSALFDVMLVLQNTPGGDGLMFPGVDIEGESSVLDEAKFDLTFNIEEDDALHVSIQYSTDLFGESTISRMATHYITLLDALVTSPATRISDVSMLSEVEEDLLCSFNHTSFVYPSATSITELFEAQVARTPNAPALSFAGETLSYAEMNHRVNQLAHYLREEQGCGVGDRVAIQLERSLEMVIAIYAVLKTGAAYVPVDPSYPLQRREYIMTDSEVCYVLDTYPDLAGYAIANPERRHTADDAAYLIYTSGSTGLPKGVVILHRALLNLVFSLSDIVYKTPAPEHVVMTASINFDASVQQLFSPLINGHCLHIRSEEQRLEVSAYIDYLEQSHIAVLDLTPSYLQVLLHYLQTYNRILPSLRCVIAGGEALSEELYRLFREVLGTVPELINVYGPTETCVDASWRLMDDTTPAGSIGRPLPNVSIYVLDEALHQTGIGVPGEICIGGVGLATGYWRREALTAEKFIQHPEFGRLYRTGDQGRWTTTGELIYQGRLDDQVKLRGFRIEPGEISNTLEQYPGVQQAIVVLHTPAEGTAFLVGYYVAHNGVSRDEITAYLQAALPEYMQPRLQELTVMPLTTNGKVDRKQLPDPVVSVHTGDEYVAPRTVTEQALAAIWTELLGVEQPGIHDNFFALGGHSLLAMRVVAAIRKQLSLEISVKLLFDEPTIAGLSSALLYSSAPALPAISHVEEGQLIPLSYSQERLWFLDRLQGSVNYHMPYVLRLRGPLNETALGYSLENIVTRHQVLRTVIREAEGTGYQQVLRAEDWQPERYHATEQQLPSLLNEILHRPFDLSADMMLRAALITLAADEHVLVIVLHHIAADGWSIGTIAHELSLLYRGETLPAMPLQYSDYAYWQRRYVQGAYLESRLAYWKEQLHDLGVLQLPTDYPRPAQRSSRGRTYHLSIPVSISNKIRSYSHSAGATLFMTMLTGLKILLHRYSGQEDICVGTPVAGRSHQELEHMVGFFVNTLALRSKVSGSDTFDELLSAIKQGTLAAYEHQEAPFEKVVETVVTTRDLSRSALFDVMLVLQNTPAGDGLMFPGVDIKGENSSAGETKFDLTFNIEEDDALHVAIQYSTDLFSESTISRMGDHYIALLDALVSSPGKPIRDVSMLSEVEEDLLGSFNHTSFVYPSATSITELFEAQVACTPDAPALSFAGETLSYAEMNHRVNQLAHYLCEEQGCGVGDRVGIQLERSLEMVIAIYAVLKTGAAYVPVDPSYPLQRREYIMTDSEVCYVLDSYPDLAGYATGNPERRHTADDAAYLIYTSGSTGLPKGVVILHRALLNLVFSLSDVVYKTPAPEHVMMTASINFDASVQQLFSPLISGQCLHIIEEAQRLDVAAYVDYLEHAAISVLDVTPSYLQIVLHHIHAYNRHLPSLRCVIAGGEALSGELYRLFREVLGPVPALINVYGPTETCVDASWRIMDDTTPAGSIGRPLPNVSIYVLDEALHQTGIGVPGEICIGGVGLAAGYWQREALTAEKFIQHPEFGRLYRTGDQGRWTTTGELIYQGRLDDQVKLRGFRIELNEITNTLEQYPGIQQATVVLHTPAEGSAFLVGYYVPNNDVSRDEITAYLQAALPEYMQPRLQELTVMPLTTNGKVDHKQLPDPVVSVHTGDEYVAPRTSTEQTLAAIWSELLGVEQIGVHDSFFGIGGHSLLVMRLVHHIKQRFNLTDFLVVTVYRHPLLRDLAAYIDTALQSPDIEHRHPHLLQLKKGNNNKPPIFILPGIAGVSEEYIELAAALETERQVYGIQMMGAIAGEEPLKDMHSIVLQHISWIKEVQSTGPYHFIGHSFGGLITYELIKELKSRGEDIAMNVLLDVAPATTEMKADTVIKQAVSFIEKIALTENTPTQAKWKKTLKNELPTHTGEAAWHYIQELLHQVTEKDMGIHKQHFLLEYANRHVSFSPEGNIEQLVLITAAETRWSNRARGLGWEKHAKNIIHSDTAGGHHTLFKGENARALAQILKSVYPQILTYKIQ